MHVHTTYSSGRYSIEELVAKAKEKNLEVLVLTDHDQVVMEYGLFPFRNIIKRREEKKSVLRLVRRSIFPKSSD
ncbi:MAG: PHP domain-containing protein [bacterium]|nr:PHP domain-containing protein [bacterium]